MSEFIKCNICQVEFIKKSNNNKYCSIKCYNKSKNNKKLRKIIGKYVLCKKCNKNFISSKKFQKYCSTDCYYSIYYKKNIQEKKCIWCDKLFMTAMTHQKFCNNKCMKKNANYLRSEGAREKIFNIYGNKCECCLEENKEFLTIDHINGGGTKHRKNKSSYNIYQEVLMEYRPDLYRILCMNCNWSLGQKGYCPHNMKVEV